MGEAPNGYLKSPTSPLSSSSLSLSLSTSSLESENDELQMLWHAPSFWRNQSWLSNQLSIYETSRNIAWERRRRQILDQERKRNGMADSDDLTDEDFNELKGSIELGFGFNEEDGQKLCSTLPALDLYFAVNRQLLTIPILSPNSEGSSSFASLGNNSSSLEGHSSSFDSPRSDSESWKICCPGDNPQQVKVKLRHWAQAVACSVMQSC
ncbi:hypothetical protein NMG60_11029671 [Bertholletia excelsa]